MRIVLGVLAAMAGALVLWLLLEPVSIRSELQPVAPPPAYEAARFAQLEQKVARLESELQRLSFELARLPGDARTPTVALAPPPATAAAAPTAEGFDPRWYLEQYVRSFEAGGDGSDYFRLAVDAYAVELLGPIGAIVRDTSANAILRGKLAAMLGTPRFAGNALAIETLFAVLRLGGAGIERLAVVALTALDVIGDAATGVSLERLVWDLSGREVQERALAVLVRLCGPDANRSLERLFASAPGDAQRALVIAALSTADPDAALVVFRQASNTGTDGLRLLAANAIQRFRGDAFTQFIDEWLGYERNEQVRRALGEARGRMQQVPPYAAQKATGAPDANPNQDHPNAWASSQADMGLQWLELAYKPARRASAVRIHEVSVAGAVVKVILVDESGRRHEVWAGDDPTAQPGVFQVAFNTTAYRVKQVRIVLDTDKRPGWAEIDAVELVGPDGNAWAAEATASSSYGQ